MCCEKRKKKLSGFWTARRLCHPCYVKAKLEQPCKGCPGLVCLVLVDRKCTLPPPKQQCHTWGTPTFRFLRAPVVKHHLVGIAVVPISVSTDEARKTEEGLHYSPCDVTVFVPPWDVGWSRSDSERVCAGPTLRFAAECHRTVPAVWRTGPSWAAMQKDLFFFFPN